jgi:uncharacterized protein (AIM24 family)
MTTTVLTPATLPKNDNINRYTYSVAVDKQIFIRKGKMIAYYGNLRFERLGSTVLEILVSEAFNSPLFVQDFICVNGPGQLILGDLGNDISGYDLDNANLTVRATHLLGFQTTLQCQESVVPGFVTLLGTGRMLASSNGPVVFMEPPCRVDEQALLGWADCPCPSFRHDYRYIQGYASAVGSLTGFMVSGEEKQVDFAGKGTVLVQSSESKLAGQGALLSTLLGQLSGLDKSELSTLASMASGMAGKRR